MTPAGRRHGTRTTFLRVAHVPATAAPDQQASSPRSARELRVDAPFVDIEERHVPPCAARSRRPVRCWSVGSPSPTWSRRRTAMSRGCAHGWMHLRDAGLALDRRGADRCSQSAGGADAGRRGERPARGSRDRARGTPGRTAAADPSRGVAAGGDERRARVRAHTSASGRRADDRVRRRQGCRACTDPPGRVPHIQADWTLHGPKLAQVALTFGADDMDNVSPLDEVAEGRRRAPLEEIRRNIRAAGFEAIERDPRFSFVG